MAHCGVSGRDTHLCGAHSAGRHLDEVATEPCAKVWLQETTRGYGAFGNISRALRIQQSMRGDR